jgi:hypothetical protein
MSRWDEIDYPVLRAIHQHEMEMIDLGRSPDISGEMITGASGIQGPTLGNSLMKLWSDDLIQAWGTRGIEVNVIKGVTAEGLRALNEWPSTHTMVEALPEVLAELSKHVDSEEDRSLLTRVGNILEHVAAATISATIAQVTGLR